MKIESSDLEDVKTFSINAIMSKCKYYGDSINFDKITSFWKNKVGAKFHPISVNSDMICLTTECIDKLKEIDCIPVDCRIFSFLYSSLSYSGCSFIMHKNCNGIEILVPENCYYLSLSKEINEYIGTDGKGSEIKSVLNDAQGQWITKIGEDKYIGILSDGIKEMSLNDWLYHYGIIVIKKMNNIKNELNNHHLVNTNVYKNAQFGILSINIRKKKHLLLSVFSFDYLGIANEVLNYKHAIDIKSVI